VNATPAQVALAWSIAHPTVAAPIVSATSVAQLDELLGAVKVKLSKEDLGVLDSASK
jgi:aryl-alcohol dehydrogenase-like predicted oxidoreductase